MAQIVINEISQNYTYAIGTSSYATVAMPITSCWGPGYFDPDSYYGTNLGDCEDPHELMLEHTVWQHFPASQQGLEAFVRTYRGPASVYRRAKDYSYQMAITLLTAGYDVLVCRHCPGGRAQGSFKQGDATITFQAKYPGTFGNNLQLTFRKNQYRSALDKSAHCYWSVITHVVDSSGIKIAVENVSFVFDPDNTSDSIPHYTEVESNFWDIQVSGVVDEGQSAKIPTDSNDDKLTYVRLSGGSDTKEVSDTSGLITQVQDEINQRYEWASKYNVGSGGDWSDGDSPYHWYPSFLSSRPSNSGPSIFDSLSDDEKKIMYYKEWIYTSLVARKFIRSEGWEGTLDLLKDKLSYSPQRIFASGWDDQNLLDYSSDFGVISKYMLERYGGGDCPETCLLPVSPLHMKLMDVAYFSRCATSFIDIPRVVDRKFVYIEDENNYEREGYAQKLARLEPLNIDQDTNGTLFHTHSALFAPWGQYRYVGVARMTTASPSFLALMIQRAQILNQADQYEWALPRNRSHKLRIGRMEYTVPKKILDKWQKLEGVGVNVITNIPDLGTNIWGNSTLFEVPPSTYQALANLSTRFLVNAVENVAFRCGVGITFQYNNRQAYNQFYAGVTPLLETMINVGAIEGYRVQMNADINGLDQVNANTVIGKIWLLVNGVVNDIYIDLIALPAGAGIDLASLS